MRDLIIIATRHLSSVLILAIICQFQLHKNQLHHGDKNQLCRPLTETDVPWPAPEQDAYGSTTSISH